MQAMTLKSASNEKKREKNHEKSSKPRHEMPQIIGWPRLTRCSIRLSMKKEFFDF